MKTEKFWKQILKGNPNDCWPWIASRFPPGYGRVRFDRQVRYAHRVAFELAIGPIPIGLWVLHKCDNPSCCNPSHLFAGTAKQNTQDSISKGRHKNVSNVVPRRGEEHKDAKLTEQQVREIKQALLSNESPRELAVRYGIKLPCIYSIKGGYSWGWLSP